MTWLKYLIGLAFIALGAWTINKAFGKHRTAKKKRSGTITLS
jgi:hypothetical protein